MKSVAIAVAVILACSTGFVFAGVTPNTAASAAARSGAKIAPPKTESKEQGASEAQGGTNK